MALPPAFRALRPVLAMPYWLARMTDGGFRCSTGGASTNSRASVKIL